MTLKNFIDGKNFFFLLSVFAVFYVLNLYMPLHRDDYEYALIWGTDAHIASLSDVFMSLKNHYFLHGGRMFSFFVLDSFLLVGKEYFNFFNALMFTLLTSLIFMHARREFSLKGEFGMLLATFILVFFSLPHFGEVIIWMCGACVYLWTGVMAGIFLLPYNLYLKNKKRAKHPLLAIVCMFFLGICAGCSVENLAVSVSSIAFCITLYAYKKGVFAPHLLSGTLGAIIGGIILILAPGNYVRYNEASDKGFLLHVANQFAGNGEMLLYLVPALLLCSLFIVIFQNKLLPKREGVEKKSEKSYAQLLLVVLFLSFLFSALFGNIISNYLRDVVIMHVMPLLHIDTEKTIRLFTNTMAGLEEMMIWIFGICLIYVLTKNALAKNISSTKACFHLSTLRLLHEKFCVVRYATLLFLLAFLNNFYMIFAPTFPARTTFFSVCMILVAIVSMCRHASVKQAFQGKAQKVIFATSICMTIFLLGQSFFALHILAKEDAKRVALIKEGAKNHVHTVILPPLEYKERVLRHIFYVDFDNTVTKTGIARYFKVQDIKVEQRK